MLGQSNDASTARRGTTRKVLSTRWYAIYWKIQIGCRVIFSRIAFRSAMFAIANESSTYNWVYRVRTIYLRESSIDALQSVALEVPINKLQISLFSLREIPVRCILWKHSRRLHSESGRISRIGKTLSPVTVASGLCVY